MLYVQIDSGVSGEIVETSGESVCWTGPATMSPDSKSRAFKRRSMGD